MNKELSYHRLLHVSSVLYRRGQFSAPYFFCCIPLTCRVWSRATVFAATSTRTIRRFTATAVHMRRLTSRCPCLRALMMCGHGCVLTDCNWIQQRPRCSGLPPVVVFTSFRGYRFEFARTRWCPQRQFVTWVCISTRTCRWRYTSPRLCPPDLLYCASCEVSVDRSRVPFSSRW